MRPGFKHLYLFTWLEDGHVAVPEVAITDIWIEGEAERILLDMDPEAAEAIEPVFDSEEHLDPGFDIGEDGSEEDSS